MSRAILFALLGAALAACSSAEPYGYGYAVHDRPSLAQLSAVPGGSDNPFRSGAPIERARPEIK
jgi:hypothetical protein